MSASNARAAALGLILDRLLPHPDRVPHPLSLFGRAMHRVEERVYADELRAGILYAAIGTGIGAVAGSGVRSTALATWLSLGGRQLHDTALEVAALLDDGDLDGARRVVPSLVGRDPDVLDADGVARAVVESVAENTVDAIVAPALWAALLGGPGVLAHRAIDTLDSMVGHRDDRYGRFGTASARLDDVVAWVPARLTVGLVAVSRPDRARHVVRAARRDARLHPSPNSGLVEASFAAALDLQLGGPTVYAGRTEDRPVLGTGSTPTAEDIRHAVGLSREVATGMTALLAGYGLSRIR